MGLHAIMDINSWQTQLRKGAAELVVLSLLVGGERYGMNILEVAGGAGGVLSDGTLYPLLKRLEQEGKIVSRWVMVADAKMPRKYYRLSEEGEALVVEMRRVWGEFSSFVSSFMEGNSHEQQFVGDGRELSASAG